MEVETTKAMTLKDFQCYARQPSRKQRVQGILLGIAAFAAIPIGLGLDVLISALLGAGMLPIGLLAVTGLSVSLWRRGKRLRTDHQARIASENKAPILYLRAFYHEKVGNHEPGAKERPDQLLSILFKDVGPLVAVGMPGEELPPLGAIRLYFKDDEWLQRVEELITVSRIVVVEAGFAVGLRQELSKIKERTGPKTFLISFLSQLNEKTADRRNDYEIFGMLFRDVFGLTLPKFDENALFLYFDEDGAPKLVSHRWPARYFFQIAGVAGVMWCRATRGFLRALPAPGFLRRTSITNLRVVLAPVLRKDGIRFKAWKTVLYMFAASNVVALVVWGIALAAWDVLLLIRLLAN